MSLFLIQFNILQENKDNKEINVETLLFVQLKSLSNILYFISQTKTEIDSSSCRFRVYKIYVVLKYHCVSDLLMCYL